MITLNSTLYMNKILQKYLFRGLLLFFTAWCLPFSGHVQNFPPLSIEIEDSAATQGYYFLAPYTTFPPYNYNHPLLILDRFGRIIFYRIFPEQPNAYTTYDFKIQPNGRMSYFNTNRSKFYLMDSTFTDVDSIGCVHGFTTDIHDFQIIPDNHYLLFGKETRIMNLTSYHWFGINHTSPGASNAQVIGVVIQEFDENKQLIWEWKGHDHYQFADVDSIWLFNPNKVDWTHANAVERDFDGNILLSLRHFDEITKIDYATKDILWRLGGKQNQFSFPNDPVRFNGQHDIRRVSDTSVSLFDNGRYSNPPRSRALEYALDETNKIAVLVWEYIYSNLMYSTACGNHQYIENGNHLVDYGNTNSGFPWMVVVKPDKTKVLEINSPEGQFSYRAFNYIPLPWQLHQPEVDCQKMGANYYLIAEEGHPEYHWSTGDTTSSIQIADTGEYFVFVPYGTGFISSEHIYVTDITNPCLYLAEPPQVTHSELNLACIPNPATDQVRIIFNLPSEASVQVSLQTLMGVKIQDLLLGHYLAGKHEVTIDVSCQQSGIYLLSLASNNTRIVRKLIIQ